MSDHCGQIVIRQLQQRGAIQHGIGGLGRPRHQGWARRFLSPCHRGPPEGVPAESGEPPLLAYPSKE